MKIQELRSKNDTELNEELIALMREMFNLRMQKGNVQSNNKLRLHDFSRMRRGIARIKTILKERHDA